MDSEVTAALVGAVVGAAAVGIVSHFDRVYRERGDSKAAYRLFRYFHSKCMEISGDRHRGDKIEKLVSTLNDVVTFIVDKGDTRIKEAFLEYMIEFNHLRTSERETPGQSHHIFTRMKTVFGNCERALVNKGLLSSLDNNDD